MRHILLTLVLVVAMAGSGLAASTTSRGPSTQNAAHPVAQKVLPDAQIERNIRAKLAKSKISADKFTVKVSGGVAILEGKTSVIQHKGVATRFAKSSGAIAVQNHIQINEEARAKAAAKLAKYRGGTEMARATVIQSPAKSK